MRPSPIALTVVATLGLATSCFSAADDDSCASDRDCGGETCTRVGVCAAAADIYALRIEWTVNGQDAEGPTACAAIGELELAIADSATDDSHAVRPVPCGTGSFYFDKLPQRFRAVTITAYSPGGRFLDSREVQVPSSAGTVRIDLRP